MDKKNFWLEEYEKHAGCTHYEIYFIFKNNLFKIEMKKLDNEIVKIGRESSSKGGWEKLRLQISSAKKQQWIIEGKAKQIMASEKFIAIAQENGLNKGQTCEYLSAKARKQEYKLDNVRFDKAGDVNLKRKKIQVKFENASLTQLRTIAKVAGLTA